VSGESGAGKTETTKHLLKYLTDSYGGGGSITNLEQRILAANPLLESFGNAKTTRNNNSSRFGKFVELHFNKNSQVIGAYVEHYLLEKSRVISQSDKERNYQVFYRMCRGAPESIRTALNLKEDIKEYRFMRSGLQSNVEGLDDVKDFAVMEKSMTDCGLDSKEKSNVFRVTAAVLHIGNIEFCDGADGNSEVSPSSAMTLQGVAQMLGLDKTDVRNGLCTKVINVGGKEESKGLDINTANFGRDALAKALYSKLFDWIVERINTCFPYEKSHSQNFIGVLDIAGFEYFQVNSFEQFCINYCNEKLQQFFNIRVLKDEQELYVKESIKFKEVEFVDNQDCIDLIETKGKGILALLDEAAKQPKASDKLFCEKIHSTYKDHFRLQLPRKSKMSYYKQLRDDEGFIIRHFAGAVCYQTANFMDKNNDALTADLAFLMDGSKDPFTKYMFRQREGEAPPARGKLNLVSLGNKFKVALHNLMAKLESTRSNFIRCIKPNQKMVPKAFQGGEILSQLQCAGMVSVLDLMQGGFPSRTAFKDLYDMYKSALPKELAALDPRTFAKALFKALGLNEDDFQFGVSKVFFRPGKFAEFDTIMKSDPENLVKLVGKVVEWLVRQRWKKIAWATVSCLKFAAKIRARAGAAILMQKVIKMFLSRRVHRPRFLGLRDLQKLGAQLTSMNEVIEKLPKNKEKMMAEVDGLQKVMAESVKKIQQDPSMTRESIQKLNEDFQKKADSTFQALRKEQEKQKLAEEAERLRKLAEEMEKERKRKEQEEKERLENEALAKQLKDMEDQAKREAEDEAKALEKLQIQREKDEANKKLQQSKELENKKEAQENALLEQERRDQELAMRLAQDQSNPNAALSADAQSAMSSGAARRKAKRQETHTFANKKQQAIHQKHDLSKWKYADLRDTINTSCDVDLLEACREEFHRRLKVYHAWKMKNMKKNKEAGGGRAPDGIHASAEARGAAPRAPPAKKAAVKGAPERPSRFFRIPFVRPGDDKKPAADGASKKKGWWFAHFDGQWIARQMELHPDKAPVLLVCGRDDMEMCELNLEETGLSRKRGAEILPREFEEEWKRCGGEPYVPAAPKGKK
jgi:myosin-6